VSAGLSGPVRVAVQVRRHGSAAGRRRGPLSGPEKLYSR